MTPGSFKCTKCDRSFSMAAHLARHQNTIHSRGGAKKRKAGRKRMKRGPGRPPGRRVGRPRGRRRAAPMMRMTRGAMDGAARLMSQMRDYYDELTTRRATLESQIAGIQSAISSIGGAAVSRARRGRPPGRRVARRGRPARAEARVGSLKDVIARVLRQSSRPQTPRDIATSAIRAGYKTKTRDLSKAVSNALPQMRNIRRVGRGLYAA